MNKIFRIVWSQATQSWVVVSELTKAHKKQNSSNSQGSAVKFSGNFIKSSAIALTLLSGNAAYAANAAELLIQINSTGGVATASGSDSIAIGKSSKATADSAVALGEAANANQARAVAIGKGATISSGQDTIAIGTDTNVQGHTSIVIGKNAKTTNTAEGTVVIGRDAFSEGSGNGGRPNTVVGRGAYTAFGEKGTYRLNAATALGFQAGSGIRVDSKNNNKLVNNETNADSNENVLVKAGYGLQNIQDAAQKVEMDKTKAFLQAGFAHNGLDKTGDSGKSTDIANGLSFYRKNHINEATAIGAEARAIGDQSIAIGGQVVAGDGVVALGGNDTDALRSNKYQVVTADAVNSTKVGTIDDFNLAYTESNRDVAGQYNYLVGRPMPTGYRSTYGQSGSVVIGMEAHSTTALGTAIGTNSVVRMGAFGATAIGAGSTVQPNAEAAVAIGMGSVANGAYALAGGTASWADYGDIALGYQAKATGKDGAIAMGRATNAQGDSSIMIGGANIESASKQTTTFEKAKPGEITKKTVTEKINGHDVDREYTFAATDKTVGTVAQAYKELTGRNMDTSAINFADTTNKNGHASTSLGVHALAKGDLGTAIGASSRAEAIGSVALGTGARATRQNAVAIGTGSTTDLVGTRQLSVNYNSDGEIVSDNSKDIAYTFKWAGGTNTSEGDVVSFGSSGAERQLKNVAAGRVAEDSTDAINGSQLNSITKKIAAGFNTSGNVVTGSSGEFTSKQKNANVDSAKKDYETAIRSEDKVQFQVGNNLKLDRDETEVEVEVPDDFNKNQKVKKKIRKADFAYSLNPVLTNLTSAEFKGSDTAPTTKLTNAGVTITPVTAGKSPVSLTENGLNNGGNAITDVAGNLEGAKTGTTAPKNKADKPANADTIKNNAATVGDVLNAGWNLQEKGAAKDFVTAYDTVNFVDGDGTSVSVTTNTDGKISEIKYSANLGDGLEKDATTNKIKVKAADNTLTTGADGLKVNTGNITASSVPTVANADKDKIATVGNVAEAIKAAAWKATSDATANGENSGKKDQEVKAGDTVTFEADKNIKIAQDNGKFTFSTKDDVEFKSVKVGEDKDGKKPVNLTTDKATDVSNNDPANKPTTALNVSSDGKPTQITGVGSVLNTTPVTTTPDGSAPTTQPNVVNLGTAHGQTALSPNVLNSAATVRDLANMGWKISSDKATGADGKDYSDVVRNADEVKFVGKNAAKVSGKTENGVRTITVDVTVPETKTAELVSSKDGSVIAPSTNPELQKALKAAKDELAALPNTATEAEKEAAKNKVKAAETALNNTVDNKGVATAKNVADMINASGFTLKTSNVDGGEKVSGNDEVINPGKAVEMIAGKNLTVKQEANGKVTYATKDAVEFTSVKVGEDKDGKKPVNFTTDKATDASNNDTANKPTTALNVSSSDGKPTQLKGVGSVLNTKAQPTSTGKQGDTPATAGNQNLVNLGNDPITGKSDLAPEILNSAATVGDLANMGWVVSTKDGNDYKDVVKNANQVDFVGKNGITVTGETGTDGVRTITVEAAQTPVVYTNKAGDKLVKVGDKFYKADEVENGKPKENAQEVPNDNVIASMNNGGNNTANKPMQLANIGSNLPTVNDTNKQAFDPNSTEPKDKKDNKSAPITAAEAAELLNPTTADGKANPKFAGNNAATVSDVLNAGWNLQGNGSAVDFVKPFDTVNFVNGKGTKAVVETADNLTSTVKFDVDAGEITSNTNGSVNGPTTAENAKKLADDLKNAQNAVNNLAPDADDAAKKKAQDALKAAQDAAAPLNKVATAQNVAEMINNSGFTLKADKTEGDNLTKADLANGETINPGDTITMKAGKNMSVKHEKDGSITYATKDEVEFNTVKVGGDANTYVDDKGNPVTKQGDSFVDAEGNKVDAAKVSPVAPVTLKTEKASPANNNAEGNHPTTALNISSGTGTDAKPTQLKGVGSVLNTEAQPTSTGKQGDTPAKPGNQNLVNLGNDPITGKSNLGSDILNSAATVGDLANMGWVVSTKDGNDYKDVVKNANQVDFKGTGLATVTGETNKDGIRTITVNVDAQKTVEAAQTPVVYTNKAGDKLVKVGDKFYKAGDVVNGKPKENAQEVPKGDVIASMNNGDNNTSKPMQLANIGSNLPTVNDTNKQAFDPNSTTPKAGKDNKSAPITAKEAADIVNNAGNNAATVSDVLNAGWNLQNNGEARDFVKPYDTVNFINGKGTVAVVETADDATSSTVKFDVDAGEITAETKDGKATGKVVGPVPADKKPADLLKAVADAQKAVDELAKDAAATPEAKKAAQDALKAAQDAAAPLNKVATAQNVADMINASGFTLKTSNVDGGEKVSGDDEVINPGKAVEMIAGKNLTVKQEANGKVTYSTKDDVEFNTVKLGDAKDGKAPVNMKTEAAKPATNNGADQPTTALNFTSGEGDKAKPTQLTGVGSTLNTQDIATAPQGKDNTNKPNVSLVNLVGTDDAPVNKNAAATVGDLQNMGWVVSTKDGNGYKDVVKNANQVDFKGTGLATVTGETDKESGIRTITVNVDAQKTVEAAQTPVVYTNKDGDKLVKVGDKFYKAGDVVNGKPKDNAQEVPKGDVIASMNNGDNKTNKPMQLANIGSNLPTVNDTNKQAFDPNSTEPKAGKDNKSAPITAKEAADIVNKAGNNAATVSDVLNAGWNLKNNGEARDFVKPYDTVNFINGKGTVAVVETADDAASSTVKFDVDAGEITSNTNGSVNGPTTVENAKKLADDLKKAEQAVKDLPADATPEAKKAAQDALKAAQDAAAPLNKVATAQNVAEAINNSGWRTNSTTATGGAKDTLINPGKAVNFESGKNMEVAQTVDKDGNVAYTYKTKDDVSFNTVNVGDNTYVDADGKPVTKNADGTYTDSKGQPIEEGKVTKLAPVAMKAEKAKPATNNGNKAEDQPTTALNVSSSDGKPTQITGVGSTLNVKPVDTNPNGTATTGDARPNLVDLEGSKDAPVNKNAAATVGDLQNMGWVVSTKDGNGYTDVVKNANQVDFKGGAGISVKGETTKDGVREITISVKDGEVVKPNQFTAKVNGTDTPVTKVGDQYYNTADIDPKTGKPKADKNPVTPDAGTTPTNAGDGYVTGNKVATAIQKSGFVVGKQTEKLSAADFKDEDEKVNPDDELRFADGNNTKVKLATKESIDKDGNKVTTTTVKVDVTGLPVQYTDKNGTPVTKVGDKYFTVDKDGNPTTTEVAPANLTTNMVNLAAKPNEIGAPTTLGNVKSNLPSVNDEDKNAKDVDGKPIAGKDNKSAPIDAAKAADIAKNAGNNAATVSDVLNAGWNLQNNGEAKDFVKPYDTVNFVDGKGTKAVVETPNGTTSNVKFDIDTGKITNNDDGSVQGPVVTPEMTKALEDATNALNSLPTTAPAAVRKAAEQAVADAANNIANVANKVATAQDVANAINKSGFTLTTSANGGEKISGTPEMINPGKKVEMVAGKNMTVKQESNGKVTYATASNVTFDSVQFGDKGPKITNKAGNINVSGPDGKTPTKITGVAPGEISATSKDAINGSQLHAVASNLNNKINKVGKHADAGTASALAAANIPQAYTPGKSLVGIAAGNYQGQNGLAVGMSRISDNGKIIIRLSGTANSQGKTGVAAGVGYQW